MKKIKKSLCALSMAICGGTALTLPLFSGCSNNPDQSVETQTAYELVSVDDSLKGQYYENDVFSVDGKSMTLKDTKTNQSIVVNLSDDMLVSCPDMTTGGQKEVVVSYDGNTYRFLINIKQKSQESVQEQFEKLLDSFKEDSIKSLSASIIANYDARFLNQISSEGISAPVFEFSKEDIKYISNINSEQQKLITEFFEALTNAVVKASFSVDKSDIDPSTYKSSLNVGNLMNELLVQSGKKSSIFDVLQLSLSTQSALDMLINYQKYDLTKEYIVESCLSLFPFVIYEQMLKSNPSMNVDFSEITLLKQYLRAINSEDSSQIAEFISNLTNNDEYAQNLEEYGTPYFFYETMNQILEQFNTDEIAREVGITKSELDKTITALLNYYKKVDEFGLSDEYFVYYLEEMYQNYIGELYKINYSNAYLKLYTEVMNLLCNKEYETFPEFLAEALNEDVLGDLCYDVLPEIMADYLFENIADDATQAKEDFVELIATTFNKIKSTKSFDDFNFYSSFITLLGTYTNMPEELQTCAQEFATKVDSMIEIGDFSDYLDAEARFSKQTSDYLSSLDSEGYATNAVIALKLEGILVKAVDLLAFGKVDDLSSFMLVMLNNETIGKDFYELFSLSLAANSNGFDREELLNEVICPALDKVLEEQSFENFDMMQRFYNYAIDSDSDLSEDDKTVLRKVLLSFDAFIQDANVENFVVSYLDYLKYAITVAIDAYGQNYYSSSYTIVLNLVKSLSIFGLNLDEFLNDMTPQGLEDLLCNTFDEVLETFNQLDLPELKQSFKDNVAVPLVRDLTTNDNKLDFSKIDPASLVDYLAVFSQDVFGEEVPEIITNTLKTLVDVKNEDYAKNLVSFENLSNILTLATGSLDSDTMISKFATTLYNSCSNEVLSQSEFESKCERILKKIYTGLEENNLDETEVLNELTRFVKNNFDKQSQTTFLSIMAVYLIASDEDIDYNDVLSFIELPAGVAVDYNKMVEKIKSRTTFEDMFNVSNIETRVVSSQDNLIEEIVEITFSVNCDVEVAKISGNFILQLHLTK